MTARRSLSSVGKCVGRIRKNRDLPRFLADSGGDGGIRTLDRALQPYNGLANRRLQPLGHVSVRGRYARRWPEPQATDVGSRPDHVQTGVRASPTRPTPCRKCDTWGNDRRIAVIELVRRIRRTFGVLIFRNARYARCRWWMQHWIRKCGRLGFSCRAITAHGHRRRFKLGL